ncbi:hypothetical protein B1692_17185 [Geobacillus thermoleovorans]|nr:hypothetical protein B1692_17185 [Geobacillus thermoleovorans]
MGDLSFRMLGDTFILLEIRQQGLFLCLSEFYLAPRVHKNQKSLTLSYLRVDRCERIFGTSVP